jgi:hypothetical protein
MSKAAATQPDAKDAPVKEPQVCSHDPCGRPAHWVVNDDLAACSGHLHDVLNRITEPDATITVQRA